MDSKALIEFRYADGAVVTGEYAEYAPWPLSKGDELKYDGESWQLYDREDRGGVTVHLFAQHKRAPEGSRARTRRRGTS